MAYANKMSSHFKYRLVKRYRSPFFNEKDILKQFNYFNIFIDCGEGVAERYFTFIGKEFYFVVLEGTLLKTIYDPDIIKRNEAMRIFEKQNKFEEDSELMYYYKKWRYDNLHPSFKKEAPKSKDYKIANIWGNKNILCKYIDKKWVDEDNNIKKVLGWMEECQYKEVRSRLHKRTNKF
jgi:hypothetical protein